ncbi:MAG: VOC family protein [Pseudomonadota bacterium]
MTNWKAPDHTTVTAFVVCRGAEKSLEFAKTVFGAKVLGEPLRRSSGEIWNAVAKIDDTTLMFAEAESEMMHRPAFLYVFVEDADATFEKAIAAGGSPMMQPADQFYGNRDGGVEDPAGNWWWIATYKEDVPHEELERRAREVERQRAGGD